MDTLPFVPVCELAAGTNSNWIGELVIRFGFAPLESPLPALWLALEFALLPVVLAFALPSFVVLLNKLNLNALHVLAFALPALSGLAEALPAFELGFGFVLALPAFDALLVLAVVWLNLKPELVLALLVLPLK